MLREEDAGYSYRWQSENEVNGDIEIRFERDEWFYSSGEQLSEICFTNYRLRSFEDTTRLPFAQSYVETTTNFGDGTTKDKEQMNEWRVEAYEAQPQGYQRFDPASASRTSSSSSSFNNNSSSSRG